MTRRNKIERNIFGKTGKTIRKFALVNDGDSVALGLSGGIDSLALMEILVNRREYLPMDYKIFAVHVKMEHIPYQIDSEYLEEFCNKLNVPLKIINSGAEFHPANVKNPCFICSKLRRNSLFDFARENSCNKLAFGHHMDDAVETLLLNMTFQGRISSMPAKLSIFGGSLEIIRPLICLSDKEIKAYGKMRSFKEMKKICPYEKESKRDDIRKITASLEELYPNAKKSIMASMSNIDDEYLYKEDSSDKN